MARSDLYSHLHSGGMTLPLGLLARFRSSHAIFYSKKASHDAILEKMWFPHRFNMGILLLLGQVNVLAGIFE